MNKDDYRRIGGEVLNARQENLAQQKLSYPDTVSELQTARLAQAAAQRRQVDEEMRMAPSESMLQAARDAWKTEQRRTGVPEFRVMARDWQLGANDFLLGPENTLQKMGVTPEILDRVIRAQGRDNFRSKVLGSPGSSRGVLADDE
jgi:hypothetical protein